MNELRDTVVLLVGHGTRKASGQDEFRKFHRVFADCLAPIQSELAFLELASPSIPEAIDRIAQNSDVRRLLVVPVLLFTAGHALHDIPAAVCDALKRTSIQLIGQTEALECGQDVIELSALRFREAVCPPACLSGCARDFCGKTAWILVGRGSDSLAATEKLREFCTLRQRWTPVHRASSAFIYGQAPSVPQALDWAAASDTELVVVQPHLLFPGLLLDELREQVSRASRVNPKQRWIVTQPLGSDRRLAEILAQTARDKMFANCRFVHPPQ